MAAGARKFKIVVQKPSGGITYDLADSAYSIEREALDPIGAEIVEVPARIACVHFAAVLLVGPTRSQVAFRARRT